MPAANDRPRLGRATLTMVTSSCTTTKPKLAASVVRAAAAGARGACMDEALTVAGGATFQRGLKHPPRLSARLRRTETAHGRQYRHPRRPDRRSRPGRHAAGP